MVIPLTDIILTILAYLYIFSIIIIATRFKKTGQLSGSLARKFVHIAIGVLVIVAPIVFTVKIIPTYIGISFIIITFLTSPGSPIPKFRLSAFQDGHDFGTVYYSISLTVLLYFFIDHGWIVQAGFLPVVFGDAFANIIGKKYGKHLWRVNGRKSIEGTLAGFLITTVIVFATLLLYFYLGLFPTTISLIIILSLVEGIAMATVELISPYGLDNLTIPLICTFLAVLIGLNSFNLS